MKTPQPAPIEDPEEDFVDIEIEADDDEEVAEPVSVARPTLQFQVLHSLCEQGVYFVDIDTGDPLEGYLDVPAVGLTLTPPPPIPVKPPLGFLHLHDNKIDPKDCANTFELDAILYFSYNGKECQTGALSEAGFPVLFFIKIWNDLDLCNWEKIVNQVVADLTINKDGESFPVVNFVVSSAYVPKNTTEPSRLVLKRKDGNADTTDGVSDKQVYPSECDCDESYRFTPIF